MAEQGQVGCVPGLKGSLGNPGVAQAGYFAIAGNFERVAGNPVNPGIADLLGHNGQAGAMRSDGRAHLGEGCGGDFGAGEAALKIGVDGGDFIGRVRAAVVSAHVGDQGEVGAGDAGDSAVIPVIHDGKACAGGISPEEDWRQLRGR